MFPIAILAGGLATRLRPLTEKIPKALVEIAGRPFIHWQLELLREQGVTDIVLCTGFLGEMIEADIGDGSAFGVKVRYSPDGEKLLGTGGALKQAIPLLGDGAFFVLYGDSYLPIDFRAVGEAFLASDAEGLMTVFRNEGQWDKSNVIFEDERIRVYDKKRQLPEMRHIDYGLGVLKTRVFDAWPSGEVVDLAEIQMDLVRRGSLAGCEVFRRFYEIGSHEGIRELSEVLSDRSVSSPNVP